nr:unknown function [Klebsiella phage vB_Ko_K4PH164]
MERDFDRYVVIKNSHAAHALTEEERRELYRLGVKCAEWRKTVGKKPFECVVVEHDWPEYETVWQMIEDRVDGFDGGREPLKGLTQLSSLARMGIAHHAFGNPIPQPIYDVIRRTEMAMVEFNQDVIRKAEMFDMIRNLMGYIENGTDTSVTLFQDDTTRGFTVAIGRSHQRKGESAPSLEEAIRRMFHKYGDKE